MVYLPCGEHVADPAEAVVEMRQTRDGRLAMMTYSALDRLKYCCGEDQPWMVVPTPTLDDIRQAQPFDLVLLDIEIPEEHRHGAATPSPTLRQSPTHTATVGLTPHGDGRFQQANIRRHG